MQLIIRSASLSAFAFALVSGTASAAAAPVHVRGTIASVSASSFSVTTAKGPVLVALAPKTKFAGALPSNIDAIKTGTFIGAANVGTAGPARALEVVVFPNSMRGAGEGDYPWDSPSTGGHSAMTNGTVAAPHASSMTNGTVHAVTSGTTRTFSVAYKGGTKQISVMPNTPIVTVEPGTKALLATGAHVFVVAVPAGSGLGAAFVVVGEHGTIPPM